MRASIVKRVALGLTASITAVTVAAVALGNPAPRVLGGDLRKAAGAREAITVLDLPAAKKILEGADPGDAALAVERARYDLFGGDYDGAATLLSRPELSATREGAELGDIARGCARGMAATIEAHDDEGWVTVLLQDDEDRALVPLITATAIKVRAQLVKDLGVELPKPLRVDLVRDQFTLAAMTGLPEKAAQTTGTVAVAKWGRVTMISPRAMSHGYPWLDTLAHEMTHLALSRGTKDMAPLWLQEGVAKREETRWREPQPLDDVPSVDSVAQSGIDKGLGRSLDKLGPSIAMLPTAEEAAVAYAEVSSFIRYWSKEVGDEGLPRLVLQLATIKNQDEVDAAIKEVSGLDLAGWDKKWRAHLATQPKNLSADLAPGAPMPHQMEISKKVRLSQLLMGRKHNDVAASELARAQQLAPTDGAIRCWFAAARVAEGDRANAAPLVEKIEDVHSPFGRWWSMHGLLHPEPPEAADKAFSLAIALDPMTPEVACEEKVAPELPKDPLRAAICEAARRVPR